MSEITGKGCRVTGMFVAMVGAGLVLESQALWVGVAVLVLGLGVFGVGLAALRGMGVPPSEPAP